MGGAENGMKNYVSNKFGKIKVSEPTRANGRIFLNKGKLPLTDNSLIGGISGRKKVSGQSAIAPKQIQVCSVSDCLPKQIASKQLSCSEEEIHDF